MDIEKLQHRAYTDTALPYISNSSVVDDGPQYVSGSNCLTSVRGFLERRPGFPTYTADNFGANTRIVRFFHWQRWDSSYFVMCNVIDTSANTSKVYKQKIGTDATFVLILTSSATNNPFFFVVAQNFVFMGNGVDMKKYDGTTVTAWGTTTPASAPTLVNAASGNVPGVIGHTYLYTYGVSATGYISDVSAVSASTNAASRQWTVTGARSTDAQVDKVHIYRTEDGGSIWRELSNSPIANPGAGTWSVTDNDADTSLQTVKAPLAGVNAPPTASNGCKWFANRIFTFVNDTLYWSGVEEITNNTMQVEAYPTNNKRRYGRQIIGIDVAGAYLLIFTSNAIYKLTGYSGATWVWGTLVKKCGLRNASALDSDGTTCVWLDVNNVVKATDGNTVAYPDLSLPIRPDIASINHSNAALSIHTVGKRNWIILTDGSNSKLYIFDLDKRHWMPPWSISPGCSVTYTAETAAGTWSLLLGSVSGSNVKPLSMDETGTAYQDAGSSYTANVITNLYSIVTPRAGGGDESGSNPASKGIVQYVGTERSNDATLANVKYLLDEDPSQGTYTDVSAASISTNPSTPVGRAFKTYLIEEWWWTQLQTQARRVSLRFDWAAANSNFKLYSFDAAYLDYNNG